jgi:hypothetical protein
MPNSDLLKGEDFALNESALNGQFLERAARVAMPTREACGSRLLEARDPLSGLMMLETESRLAKFEAREVRGSSRLAKLEAPQARLEVPGLRFGAPA